MALEMAAEAHETEKRIATWKRLDGVDILRGLAILFVLMNHVNIRLLIAEVPYLKILPRQAAHTLVWNGQMGVQMFFVVSGFLITSTTLKRWGTLSNINVWDFYRLRFARIAPLLIALLAILSILHFAHVSNYVVAEKTGGLGRALLAALTFRVNVLEARRGYLPGSWDVLWSLSVEEMFYLFFPLACWLLGRGKWFIGLLGILVVLGPFGRTVWTHGSEIWEEYSYLGRMDAIALGCLTALLVSKVRFSRRNLQILLGIGLVMLVFVLGFSIQAYHWGFGRTGMDMTVLAVGTCLVIITAAQTQWKSPKILEPLLTLGRNSYEVYLTHMFLVFTCFGLFLQAGSPMRLVPVFFLMVIIGAALLGAAVARFYSEPVNRRLRTHFGYQAKSTLAVKPSVA
jgi:peptidoglycan/LPS O-acetylase OafA/YrhL